MFSYVCLRTCLKFQLHKKEPDAEPVVMNDNPGADAATMAVTATHETAGADATTRADTATQEPTADNYLVDWTLQQAP